MTVTERVVSRAAAPAPGSFALGALGSVVVVVGAAWWAFDADPARGKWLLALGLCTALVGWATRRRLGPSGQRWLLIVVGILAVATAIEVVHLIQVINDQRAAGAA